MTTSDRGETDTDFKFEFEFEWWYISLVDTQSVLSSEVTRELWSCWRHLHRHAKQHAAHCQHAKNTALTQPCTAA